MRNIILSVGLAMLLAQVALPLEPLDPPTRPQPRSDVQVAADFQVRVERYAALHRQLETTTTLKVVPGDWSSVRDADDALAGRIRTARADARRGDVFTPDVERSFRRTLTHCLEAIDIEDFLARMNEEDWQEFILVPEVNGRWPEGAPLPTMPPHLLAVLPPLPEELQYRFMNRDLVLWDMHANVIVDVIKGAL